MERIQKYLSHLQNALNLLSLSDVRQVIDMVMSAYENDKQIFAIGNGGSASDAQHLATEITVRYKKNRKALPAISLATDTSALTCLLYTSDAADE